MSDARTSPDFLARARGLAVVGMLAASGVAIVGSALDWAVVDSCPTAVPTTEPVQEITCRGFTGLEARDGWYVVILATLLVSAALLLQVRRKGGYGWLGFLLSFAVGTIGIADYRGVSEISSAISHRMDVVGRLNAGVGVTLVAAAGLIGVICSLVGVAATPRADD